MENENEPVIGDQVIDPVASPEAPPVEEEAEVETADDDDNIDTTDWKSKAEEAEKRIKTLEFKASKRREKTKGSKSQASESGELDYGHIAFFNSNSETKISESDEEFILKTMDDTGKSQKDLLGKKWFMEELKEHQGTKTVKEAIPSTTKRSSSAARDSVDYWISRGEMPPTDQVELTRKVLNKRIDIAGRGSRFSNNPVVNS